ncbi:hypothetical protein NDU88_004054 [Pleurodeles waltl]|uniref:Uncharacterized protein n=1 Tax=Pleurodeles waltl TaxID=8319 RepID=A0AAV7LHG0_PLEWA|nr:hypothetical protein NDU88_004054 [Pleurodeles waltl]
MFTRHLHSSTRLSRLVQGCSIHALLPYGVWWSGAGGLPWQESFAWDRGSVGFSSDSFSAPSVIIDGLIQTGSISFRSFGFEEVICRLRAGAGSDAG